MLSMTSTFNRVYSLFYMSMTAFCIVAGIGAIMAMLYNLDVPVSFDISQVEWFGPSSRHFEEANFLFNISADFTPMVHVNTRLFYTYVVAEWSKGENDSHSIILWNRLVKRESPKIEAINLPGNFTFRQVGIPMKGKPIKLSFKIQLVPFIGFFRTKVLSTKEFMMPKQYIQPEQK